MVFLLCFLIWSLDPRQTQAQQDTNSIFFVHPTKDPNFLVVSRKLNVSNYFTWNHSMQWALGAKNKLAFIIGNVPIPGLDYLNHSAWERCNYLIHSWRLNTVFKSISQTFTLFIEYFPCFLKPWTFTIWYLGTYFSVFCSCP